MNYIEIGKIPPNSKNELSTPEQLVENLKSLIGEKFPLTGKPRTDGSNFRKMITNHLLSNYIPKEAVEYEIVPPKQKGVPSFLREYIDTYIVTSGVNYNLQVWNRNPNSSSVQVDLKNGETLLASDVRFVLGKINADEIIESIVIMTPEYIENRFGKFGKPTVKQQLIISNKKREEILKKHSMIVADTNISVDLLDTENNMVVGDVNIKDEPERVLPIETINQQVTEKLLGEKLDISLSTKQRGQQLERMVAYQLGYKRLHEGLEGGYPVRYPFAIGKDDYTKRLLFYVEHVIKSEPMYIDNIDYQMSYIRSDEAGEFIAYLVDKDVKGAINGSALETISLREVINYIEEKTGKSAALSEQGEAAPYNGEPEYSINTDKAEKTGYRFSNLKDWIYELLDYYIEQVKKEN